MWSFTNYLVMYDIADARRLLKVCSVLRSYLLPLQNSVFEGRLARAQYLELEAKLKSLIDKEKDSVVIYPLNKLNVYNKVVMGKRKFNRTLIF